MKRKIMADLIAWKNSRTRKPLLLKGARQVGKTWILKEFGRTQYDSYVYLNFDKQANLSSIFEDDIDPERILSRLSLLSHKKISPENTLIIFDEIQACPKALNSIKYFKEEKPEYHVAAAGSLMGLALDSTPVPVGAADIIHMYPMTFSEFLEAKNGDLYEYYSSISKKQIVEKIFHDKLTDEYLNYVIIGGMPECVSSFLEFSDLSEVDRLMDDIIELYENDFTKYSGRISAERILQVFRSIPSQLAKPNEKFIYGAIRKGARSVQFEGAIEWLVSAGLINRVYNVSEPGYPLRAYANKEAFKLFLLDTGLLRHMAGVDNAAVALKSPFQFKGPLAENYILQQMLPSLAIEPFYYSTPSSEIDFMIQHDAEIIPIEVKSGEDREAPSFKKYIQNRQPNTAIRFSMMGYKKSGEITNIPLYLAARMQDFI